MAKKAWAGSTGAQSAPVEEVKEEMTEGFSLSGLFTVDLQRQTIRFPTAAGLATANHPDNRIDFDMTGGTVTYPPGWHIINF